MPTMFEQSVENAFDGRNEAEIVSYGLGIPVSGSFPQKGTDRVKFRLPGHDQYSCNFRLLENTCYPTDRIDAGR